MSEIVKIKRPDKSQYLKFGINAAQLLEQYDLYCEEIEKQNTKIYEALKEFNIQLNQLKANYIMEMMIEYPEFANSIDKLRSLLKEIEK